MLLKEIKYEQSEKKERCKWQQKRESRDATQIKSGNMLLNKDCKP